MKARGDALSGYRVRFQTYEFEGFDIHLRTLLDRNQFFDPLGEAEALGISSAQWSLFGVVWDSSQVLAHELQTHSIENKRILEVGCGIGLTSMMFNARHADITASDYHPEVGYFLVENTRLNNGDAIPYLRADWTVIHEGLGKFDLIVGSDLLYEVQHIKQLSSFIDRHAKPECEVVIVDPGRGNHAAFSKHMVKLGFSHEQHKPESCEYLTKPFKGNILRYCR
jgi:predicted nicotinamide N-methyase